MSRFDHPETVGLAYGLIKRVCDLLIALCALAILGLPMLVIGLRIAIYDGGSPLFRQIRVGRHCRHFAILKFRSMVTEAEKLGGYNTDAGDSRITPFGRFLRRTSIDELPQLINVVLGDMSLIGPRPDVPAQESNYSPAEWRARHAVRPGLTGLAQASDRSLLTPEKRAALDLRYVKDIGISLDLRIMAMTMAQIFRGGST